MNIGKNKRNIDEKKHRYFGALIERLTNYFVYGYRLVFIC